MKISPFVYLLLLCFQYQIRPEHQLEVKITGAKNFTGTVRLCLVDDKPENYLIGCDQAFTKKVTGSTTIIPIKNLPSGSYCIYVYQDVDNDGKMNNDGLFGLPSEPYGFSNNPSTLFGPPKQKKCLFEINSNQTIEIKLK